MSGKFGKMTEGFGSISFDIIVNFGVSTIGWLGELLSKAASSGLEVSIMGVEFVRPAIPSPLRRDA